MSSALALPPTQSAAASTANAKVKTFLSLEDDALSMPVWPGSCAWLNPPYGRGKVLHAWLGKVVEQLRVRPRIIVTLTAARTDTAWFCDNIWQHASEIRFIRGRLLFELDGEPQNSPAPFPSVIAVFRSPAPTSTPTIRWVTNRDPR